MYVHSENPRSRQSRHVAPHRSSNTHPKGPCPTHRRRKTCSHAIPPLFFLATSLHPHAHARTHARAAARRSRASLATSSTRAHALFLPFKGRHVLSVWICVKQYELLRSCAQQRCLFGTRGSVLLAGSWPVQRSTRSRAPHHGRHRCIARHGPARDHRLPLWRIPLPPMVGPSVQTELRESARQAAQIQDHSGTLLLLLLLPPLCAHAPSLRFPLLSTDIVSARLCRLMMCHHSLSLFLVPS
jgi:hypothetical protein